MKYRNIMITTQNISISQHHSSLVTIIPMISENYSHDEK